MTVMDISSGKECKIISKEEVENLGPSFDNGYRGPLDGINFMVDSS